MVLRAHSLFNIILDIFSIFFLLSIGLSGAEQEEKMQEFEILDVSIIPTDTILWNSEELIVENGIYYLHKKLFSGIIESRYENGSLKNLASYYQGKQHGVTKSYYPDGTLRDERSYKENLSYGRHFGYWENGNMKFDFVYYNDKREGMQKQWYESGEPYAFLSFRDDQEEGMQRAWRINGKPYINYEVKDGIRYGLQKAALCYTLKDEKLK